MHVDDIAAFIYLVFIYLFVYLFIFICTTQYKYTSPTSDTSWTTRSQSGLWFKY